MRNFKYYYYCSEDISLIENYEMAKADDFNGWYIHHRLETHNFDGTRRNRDLSREDLIALDLYICRPASELIFMRIGDHMSLHNKGKAFSEEHKKKLSEDKKRKFRSEKYRKKLSEAMKGIHWFTNGVENRFCFECPEGFVKGRNRSKENKNV